MQRWMTVGVLVVFVLLSGLAATANAQSALAGVVRDASGGVLPGVTVEASSPAFIEKVRMVVTDDAGQYRIIDLRPGVYQLTFKDLRHSKHPCYAMLMHRHVAALNGRLHWPLLFKHVTGLAQRLTRDATGHHRSRLS